MSNKKKKINKREIESIIAEAMTKAGLTENEAKVARVYYGSKSAGRKTKFFVCHLSDKKYSQLLVSARKKIKPLLLDQKG